MNNEKFVMEHHQIQETCNNCFGSKKYNTTLHKAKTGKHDCRNIAATYCYISALVFTCFCLIKGHVTFFDPKQLVQVSCI